VRKSSGEGKVVVRISSALWLPCFGVAGINLDLGKWVLEGMHLEERGLYGIVS
jgi:hypothetical protein